MNSKRLALFRKKFATDEFEETSKKLNNRMTRVSVSFPSSSDPHHFVANFSVKSLTQKGLGRDITRQFYRLVQLFVDKSKRIARVEFEVYSEVMLVFPKSQRFLNLPRLPFTITPHQSAGNLGIGQLDLLALTFRKSRLGLRRAALAYQNRKQTLQISSTMKITNTSKLSERVYAKSYGIASFFLVS
jgi:hypothetical protein